MSCRKTFRYSQRWTDYGLEHRPKVDTDKWVGYWQIGGRLGVAIHREKRPSWLHRFMNKLFFGFEWRDGFWSDNKD
jgi:hypothetical protein